MSSELASDHPIDLTRYQVANCHMGRAGLINSGGASGEHDLYDAVRTAVINKRAGGTASEFPWCRCTGAALSRLLLRHRRFCPR